MLTDGLEAAGSDADLLLIVRGRVVTVAVADVVVRWLHLACDEPGAAMTAMTGTP